MEASTQGDNPTNKGAVNKGDVNTSVLDNLAAKPSGGADATSPPASTTDKTGQSADDKVTKPDDSDDSGAVDRLKQQLAQSNQLLAALNIDPESDLAERYTKGVVSKEELLLRVNPQPQPIVTEPSQTPVSARQRLENLKRKVTQSVEAGKGVLETDIVEVLDVVSGITDENDHFREQTDMERHFAACRDATLAVIDKDELHNTLPEDIKEIESQVFLSSTDNLLSTQSGGNPKSLTVKNYDYYAYKNLNERISAYRNYWIDQGKKLQQQATTKTSTPQVNPISPTTGSAPVVPVETPTTIENTEERARQYVENWGAV